MARLHSVLCPGCGNIIESEDYPSQGNSGAPMAFSFEMCLRRCEACGIGMSNAKDKAVLIYREPSQNVPAEVSDGVHEALALALNERNRASKLAKFGFETSEDAVTWTVLRYLLTAGSLSYVMGALLGNHSLVEIASPTLLLWGVPVPSSNTLGWAIRSRLEGMSNELKENSTARSEPDVIVDFGAFGLVLIEVKYRSGNDIKPGHYAGFNRYLNGTDVFLDTDVIRKSGCYELARNWRIGAELAGPRHFTLINLGPAKLFESEKDRLEIFAGGLSQDKAREFLTLSWPSLLRSIPESPPRWFIDYISSHDLVAVSK